MWEKRPKKTLFTLCVDNFEPEITELTFPLMKGYADKIRADFHIIKERKFPDFPPVYEKLQIYTLGKEMQNDWNFFLDADALIHPDTIDFTEALPKDTVMHHGKDFASMRWTYDRYFRRDGRNIGSGNWFALASDWCIDLWEPLDPKDLTFEEAVKNIHPLVGEINSGVVDPKHLIDDYVCSRNIAKYGLKFITAREWIAQKGIEGGYFFWHAYTIPRDRKVQEMKKVLKEWGVMK